MAGATATSGTRPVTGAANIAARNRIPTTIAQSPVRPPASIPEALSM